MFAGIAVDFQFISNEQWIQEADRKPHLQNKLRPKIVGNDCAQREPRIKFVKDAGIYPSCDVKDGSADLSTLHCNLCN